MDIKKLSIPVGIIVLFLLVLFITFKYLNRNTWKLSSNTFQIDMISTASPKVIPHCEIPSPLDLANYSIDFKIFIDNFNENHTYWRHVFHKGTYASLAEPINFKFTDQSEENNGWKDLVQEFKEQGLGVWLHPNTNTLRVCVTTRVDLKEKENYDLRDHPMGEFIPKKKYGEELLVDTMDQIEFCDLNNIPVKEICQITITLEKNVLMLYVNKTLRKVCTFEGAPMYNNQPMFFVHQRTFDGYLQDFRVIPYFLKDTQIAKL